MSILWRAPTRLLGAIWTVTIWLVVAAALAALILLAATALALELT